MRTADFDYDLDTSLIAQVPVSPRDHAKLLVLSRDTGTIRHHIFADLPALLHPGDALVMNDTSVIPARLIGKKLPGGGRVDLCLVRERAFNTWDALIRGRVRVGQVLAFADGVNATVLDRPLACAPRASRADSMKQRIQFHGSCDVRALLPRIGVAPLPPYIKRPPTPRDADLYQTVYAEVPGAIAAPTAGRHFTHELLGRLRDKGVRILTMTLHTGMGTFLPVHTDAIEDHRMEAEWFSIPPQTASELQRVKADGKRIVAVGTTAVKGLETAVTGDGVSRACEGDTALFIYPGFHFQVVDALITNFHLPKTTLLMLVCAFSGKEVVLRAYREAMHSGYRFYSYGDAMLIL